MKILCIHGLGDHRNAPWKDEWSRAIAAAWPGASGAELRFGSYDAIFEEVDLSFGETTRALAKLSWSGISSLLTRSRGMERGLSHAVRWMAGYVVAWVEDEGFKEESRRWFHALLRKEKPDLVLAHSLGSLITYDALAHPTARRGTLPGILDKLTYVTLGSQIGNPFVRRNLTPGRITRLDVGKWVHLFNPGDNVFTSPVRLLDADNFVQLDTPFDLPGDPLNHAAPAYLGHASTVEGLWSRLDAAAAAPVPTPRALGEILPRSRRKARRRAILVGINEYPNPDEKLAGCVNDVFLVSSVLQEAGFRPEEIRVLLDERATAREIRDRLEWLVDDVRPDDELFFYYSGHGARIPAYGVTDEPDHQDEVLVAVDFDWTAERSVRDDDIFEIYSQLPFDTRLVMMFDCCHSGSIHRDGAPRARGITPPDDIRHRSLRWDARKRMWVERSMEPLNEDFSDEDEVMDRYFGRNRSTVRLGRSAMLRTRSKADYERLHRQKDVVGPYLPIIIEACREDEYAYEYRHGVTSYGAFTYSMANHLRAAGRRGITYRTLVEKTGGLLGELGYRQHPQILGPSSQLNAKVPRRGA